jgi:hypothetical protein
MHFTNYEAESLCKDFEGKNFVDITKILTRIDNIIDNNIEINTEKESVKEIIFE